jgi:serine/threonine-protein kinase
MFKVCYESPVPPSVAARLPSLQAFDAVVMKALARRPEDRYAGAAQFLEGLLQAQAHAGGSSGSDETIIQPRTPAPAVGKESISQPPSTNTLVGSGWDRDDLALIEKRLARYVGPIARVMVRRAAKDTLDVVTLTHALAAGIAKPADREEFLKGAGVGAPPRSKADPEPPGGRQPGPGRGAPRSLTPEDISLASQLLTAHVGPIAAVLAKRAAAPGVSRDQFIASLASHLSDDAARSRFIEALG